MHRDYSLGESLTSLASRYGRDRSCLSDLFRRHGLGVRPPKMGKHGSDGRLIPYTPKTEAEVRDIICGMTRVYVPESLRVEWRHWLMHRRRDFIVRVRAHLQSPKDRPKLPFSKNVEPFDYWTDRANLIAKWANTGKPSRIWPVRIYPSSQGVIWKDQLWFWASNWPEAGGAYYRGAWKEIDGRPALHHTIWEQHNGQTIPAGHVLTCKDGNPNNLDPANLVLESRDSICRKNQAVALSRKSRELTQMLLRRQKEPNEHHHTTKRLAYAAGRRYDQRRRNSKDS